jgi:hypothetical protein
MELKHDKEQAASFFALQDNFGTNRSNNCKK